MEDSTNPSLMMKHFPRQKYHCKDCRTKIILRDNISHHSNKGRSPHIPSAKESDPKVL
jgi:hypothetical protein